MVGKRGDLIPFILVLQNVSKTLEISLSLFEKHALDSLRLAHVKVDNPGLESNISPLYQLFYQQALR